MATYSLTWSEAGSGVDVLQCPTVTEYVSSLRATGGDYSLASSWESQVKCDLTAITTRVASHGGVTGTMTPGYTCTASPSGVTGMIRGVTATQILISGLDGELLSTDTVTDDTNGGSCALSSVPATAKAVLEGYDDWGDGLSDNLYISEGWVTDELHPVIFRAAAGHEHDGVWSEPGGGFRFKGGITVDTQYARFEDLATKPYGAVGIKANASTLVTIDRCLLNGNTTGGGQDGILHDSGEVRVYNSAIYRFGGSGITGGSSGRRVVYNCTVWGCTQYGVRNGTHVRNTASGGNGLSDFTFSGAAHDYNASEDATATGAHSRPSVTVAQFAFEDTTAGTEDFHLNSASSYLYNRGQDLHDNPDAIEPVPDYDFERQRRPRATAWTGGTSRSYDIGADERFIALNPGSLTFPYRVVPVAGDVKFILTGDATADGSGFVFGGANIRLNLGGHTLTFGNSTTGRSCGIWNSSTTNFSGNLIPMGADDIPSAWLAVYSDTTVYNGSIVQGASKQPSSMGIAWNSYDIRVHDLSILMTGYGSPGTYARYAYRWMVHNCAITATWHLALPDDEMRHDCRAGIYSRSMDDTATTIDIQVYDNIVTGYHNGIVINTSAASTSPPARTCFVRNNRVSHDGTAQTGTTATNSFGIQLQFSRVDCAANTVISDHGHGIHTASGRYIVIRNNRVRVRHQSLTYFLFGIELEDSTYYAEVYGNNVYAFREDPEDTVCYAIELGQNSYTYCEVHHNTFEMACNGAGGVTYDMAPAAVVIYGHPSATTEPMECSFHDNILISDNHAIFFPYNGGNGVELRDNIWVQSGGSGNWAYWRTQPSSTGRDVLFFDEDYGSFDRENDYALRDHAADYCWLEHYSTLTITATDGVNPLNAHALVTDPVLGTLLDADIGADGIVSIDARYIRADSLTSGLPDFTHYGPLTVTVTYGGQQQVSTVTYNELYAGAHTEPFVFGNAVLYGDAASGADAYAVVHTPHAAVEKTYREAASGADGYAIVVQKALTYDGTTYYVRMQARDSSDETSAWSAVAQFIMSVVAPLAKDGTTYYVRIMCRDEYGYESEWSAYGAGQTFFVMVGEQLLAYAEAGSGADAYQVDGAFFKTYDEAGSGADAYDVRVNQPSTYAEAGSGVDAYTVKRVIGVVYYDEAGSGSDAYNVAARKFVDYDEAGSGADAFAVGAPSGPGEEITVTSTVHDEVEVTSGIHREVRVTGTVIG